MIQKFPANNTERLEMLRTIERMGRCDFAYSCFLLQNATLQKIEAQLQKFSHAERMRHIAESRCSNATSALAQAVARLEMQVRSVQAEHLNIVDHEHRGPFSGSTLNIEARCALWIDRAECYLDLWNPSTLGGSCDAFARSSLAQALALTRQAQANLSITVETVQIIQRTCAAIQNEVDDLLSAVFQELCVVIKHRSVADRYAILDGYGLLESEGLLQNGFNDVATDDPQNSPSLLRRKQLTTS